MRTDALLYRNQANSLPPTQRLNRSIHTAFERAVLASKSYLIALGLVEGFLSVDDAAKAAHVEVQSQIDRWGEVEDSEWGE